MSKRSYPLRFECKHAGCKESTTYRFDTLRDLRGSFELKHYGKDGWLCIRHQRPDEVLSSDNPQIVTELINEEHEHGRFLGNRRFVYGPGFKAFAQDFPPGTRLLITARVEFPSAAPAAEPVAWLDPVTLDVITDERKRAWETEYGHGGAAKAKTYTILLAPLPHTKEPK